MLTDVYSRAPQNELGAQNNLAEIVTRVWQLKHKSGFYLRCCQLSGDAVLAVITYSPRMHLEATFTTVLHHA